MDAPARPIAVITGASSGLGAALAERLARRGHDVALIARRADRLDVLAARLESSCGIRTVVIAADLTSPGAPAAIRQRLRDGGWRAQTLVNAAGFGTAGDFIEEDPDRVADEIAVNVTALTVLTRLLLPDLTATPGGLLLNISSTAGHQPVPRLAVYAATKAYVTSLTAAISDETRAMGLRVVALCPGPTATEFFDAAGSTLFQVGAVATTKDVIDATMNSIDRGAGPVVTVGLAHRVQAVAARLAPRALTLAVASRGTRRREVAS